MTGDKGGGRRRADAGFATTRWSIVIAAGAHESPQSRDALAVLCEAYWYPLYAFARRRGYPTDQSEDLTQGFFARFLEKNDVRAADRSRGKFRSFLLSSFKHFLANEWDRSRTQKRGGSAETIHIDFASAEGKYASNLARGLSPEQEYERQWALAVLDEVFETLRGEYEVAGKGRLFAQIQAFLPGSTVAATHRECAEALSATEAAVKMAVSRLRGRYRKLLRQKIADTLDDPGAVDEEIRYLLDVLSV